MKSTVKKTQNQSVTVSTNIGSNFCFMDNTLKLLLYYINEKEILRRKIHETGQFGVSELEMLKRL